MVLGPAAPAEDYRTIQEKENRKVKVKEILEKENKKTKITITVKRQYERITKIVRNNYKKIVFR